MWSGLPMELVYVSFVQQQTFTKKEIRIPCSQKSTQSSILKLPPSFFCKMFFFVQFSNPSNIHIEIELIQIHTKKTHYAKATLFQNFNLKSLINDERVFTNPIQIVSFSQKFSITTVINSDEIHRELHTFMKAKREKWETKD